MISGKKDTVRLYVAHSCNCIWLSLKRNLNLCGAEANGIHLDLELCGSETHIVGHAGSLDDATFSCTGGLYFLTP